jgi:xanthine dehydrogenase accessory factor
MNPIEATKKLIDEERLGAVVTVVDGRDAGMKAVIDLEDGVIAGEIPASLASDVTADAAELMQKEQNKTLLYGEIPVFIETLAPQPVMLIFGAGHNAQPLTTMAKLLGFRVVVADARPMWATRDRFPDADEVIVGWPDQVFEKLTPDRRTYVVLLSHDVRFEDPVFAVVHGKPIRYLGAIGSRRTHAARRERLAAAGWTERELGEIFGPIGLDIGAETPAEMAVSILGEIVQARYGMGSGTSLRGEEGRINKRRGET